MAVWHGSSMFVPVNIVTLHCAKSVTVSRVQVTFAPSWCLINHLNQLSLVISSQVSRMSNAIVITAKWKKWRVLYNSRPWTKTAGTLT